MKHTRRMPRLSLPLLVVATSASFDNTSEIVEFDSWWGGTFTVRAVNFRCDKPTFLGWAWQTS